MPSLPLPVPDVITAAYLVVGRRAVADPVAALRDGLPGEDGVLAERVAALALDHDLLAVDTVEVDAFAPPAELLAIMGTTPEDLDALAAGGHGLLVRAHGPPHPRAAHEIAARWAADRLAVATDARVVVDLLTPQVVARHRLLRDPADEDPVPLSDLVVVAMSPGERGHWVTTKGLGRYGLPELQVLDVPPPLAPTWGRLLTGLGRAVVDDYTAAVRGGDVAPAFVEIDDHPILSIDHVAAAYGHAVPDEGGEAMVRLRFDPVPDPDADQFLAVVAPDDHARSAGEFLVAVVDAVTGATVEGEMGYVAEDDQAMAEAVATAQGCLDHARARFLAGELSQDRLLMVKWVLPTDTGAELPWMFVTDWSDPERLHGTAAVDAHADPTVVVGRPVSIDAGAVADWGVYVDGEGFVEGGWTNAVLQGDPPPPVPRSR